MVISTLIKHIKTVIKHYITKIVYNAEVIKNVLKFSPELSYFSKHHLKNTYFHKK